MKPHFPTIRAVSRVPLPPPKTADGTADTRNSAMRQRTALLAEFRRDLWQWLSRDSDAADPLVPPPLPAAATET